MYLCIIKWVLLYFSCPSQNQLYFSGPYARNMIMSAAQNLMGPPKVSCTQAGPQSKFGTPLVQEYQEFYCKPHPIVVTVGCRCMTLAKVDGRKTTDCFYNMLRHISMKLI